MVDLNKMYQLHGNPRIFTEHFTSTLLNGQTDRQTKLYPFSIILESVENSC